MCVRMKTRLRRQRECARRSVEVVSGVRIVRCHAVIDVVIDVRVMECHASMDVVIGVRVVLCHPLIDNFTFLNFSLRVQILNLSCCSNSSSLFPVAILCTLLHRGNMSFEVWYLQRERNRNVENLHNWESAASPESTSCHLVLARPELKRGSGCKLLSSHTK